MARPATDSELAEAVRAAGPFEILGQGTKRGLGRPLRNLARLEMGAFKGIHLYEPDELVLEAGAATPLDEIEKLLAKENQQLAFEPPDYSTLLGVKGRGTLGGLVACGLSGPRRIKAGALRDHILGLSGVSGRGEIFKAGGRVVKNVTGFDLPKLLAGSFGTLAALTRITLKVLPAAETEVTLVLERLDDARALSAMSMALQSPCEVSGAAHLPGAQTLLRLEGTPKSIAYRFEKLSALLKGFGAAAQLDEKKSREAWISVRDVLPLGPDGAVWKISVAPTEGAQVIEKISARLDVTYFYDWGGGLIWLSTPEVSADIIRGSFAAGHATLMRATDDVRMDVPVFQPQDKSLAALEARVREAFDPQAKLNPGRM
jgi:glycolate oxidase FAD binding subunit